MSPGRNKWLLHVVISEGYGRVWFRFTYKVTVSEQHWFDSVCVWFECVGSGLSKYPLRHSLGKGDKDPQGTLLELRILVRWLLCES